MFFITPGPREGTPAPRAMGAEVGDRVRHNPALDGVRGLAILIVMLHHHTVMRGISMLDLTVGTVLHLGGVGLFFVLSGYLITGILLDSKGGKGYFTSFYARRALRIFPLYYALLVFALVILPRFAHAKAANFGRIAGDEWSYWVFLQNFTISAADRFRHAMLDVTWTLSIEEQFYLIWPLVVLLVSRKALERVALSLIVIALVVRCIMAFALDAGQITIFVLTPCRMDVLAVGAWLAARERGPAGREALASLVPWAKWVGMPLGAVVAAIATWEQMRINLKVEGAELWFTKTINYSFWMLWFASIVLLAMHAKEGSWWRRLWTSRVMRTFGLYSFGLYLFHTPIRALIRDVLYGPADKNPMVAFPVIWGSEIPAQIAFYAITFPLVVAVAALSYHLWEKPFLRLKRYFPVPRPAASNRAAG